MMSNSVGMCRRNRIDKGDPMRLHTFSIGGREFAVVSTTRELGNLYPSSSEGVRAFGGEAKVVSARNAFLSENGIDPERMARSYVTHGRTVRIVRPGSKELSYGHSLKARKEGEALVTAHDDISLSMLAADCAPLVMVVPSRHGDRVVQIIVHCSRQTILSGLLYATYGTVKAKFGHDGGLSWGAAQAFIGPTIRRYEVACEHESVLYFEEIGATSPSGVKGKICLDLVKAIRWQMDSVGIEAEQISDSGIDTYHDERFWSYRRNANTGNNLIALCRT